MNICWDEDISCKNTIGNILENCPLRDYWGDSMYEELSLLDPSSCIEWEESTCDSVEAMTEVVDEVIEFNLDIYNGCFDCDGNPCDDKLSWIGDGTCDENGEINFSCQEFNCDMNDCGEYYIDTEQCGCQTDCMGQCIDNYGCYLMWGHYGYDCCINDETCSDFNGDGFIVDAIGDGLCIDGNGFPFSFACEEAWSDTNENGVWDEEEIGFNFECDGGDCGVWNPETSQCEPAPGQVIRYFDDEFYPESYE